MSNVKDRQLEKASTLIDKGHKFKSLGQYSEAIETFTTAGELYRSLNEREYSIYCDIHLFDIYDKLGDITNLEQTGVSLFKIYNDWYSGLIEIHDHTVLIMLSETIARIFARTNMIDNAIQQREQIEFVLSSYRDILDLLESRINNLHSLAILYQKTHKLDKAIAIIDSAIVLSEHNEMLSELNILCNILKSNILKDLGRVGQAIELISNLEPEVSDINKETIAETYYSNYSSLLAEVGRFEEAFAMEERLLTIISKIYGGNSEYYANALLNLGELQGIYNQCKAAKQSTAKACKILDGLYGKNNPAYYAAFSKFVDRAGIDMEDNYEALLAERLTLARNIFGEQSKEYAEALIYSIHLSLTPTDNDIVSLEKGIAVLDSLGLNQNIEYLTYIDWLAIRYLLAERWDECYDLDNKKLMFGKSIIQSSFLDLTEIERKGLWNRLNQAFASIASKGAQYASLLNDNPKAFDFDLHGRYSKQAYDALLLQKGLLLSASIKLKEVLENSSDSRAKELLQELSRMRQNPSASAKGIEMKERELLQYAKSFGTFTDFIDISWQDVQQSLKPGEIAIEFFSYPAQNVTNYCAVWMSYKSAPCMIGLCNSSELESLVNSETYDGDGIYRSVWRVLEAFSEIRDAQTIYFSPSGILNLVAIEYALCPDGKRYNETKNIYRLSSTRELIANHTKGNSPKNAVLFGGLDYDMEADEFMAENRASEVKPISPSRSMSDRGFRFHATYLLGSKEEVEQIDRLMADADSYSNKLITGRFGTEKLFKSLTSTDKIDILHLATHGFFWDDETSEQNKYVSFLANIEKVKSKEGRALLQSGLFLSGANVGLRGEILQENVDDGILTAQEISDLNLGNVDLVVMSACQSGLGVTTGEGVFGLQRGFKLAGANTLLMSLWKVDDEATKILMTEFYRHLLSGKSKRESLLLAQKHLQAEPKFSISKYWAAFILLDAFN